MSYLSQRRFAARLVVLFALATFFSFCGDASAQPYYRATYLGRIDPDARTGATQPNAVNSSAQVVGATPAGDPSYRYRITAFLWQNGIMTDIGTMTGSRQVSIANDINDAGQVVGFADTLPSYYSHAIWWHDGTYTDLHPILMQSGLFSDLGTPEDTLSYAIKINNSGQILGYVQTLHNVNRGFIYANGTVTVILLPGDSPLCCPPQFTGLNNSGQVAGYFALNGGSIAHTFVWDTGTTSVLSQLEGWPTSNGADINDGGQIVGRLYNGVNPDHSFLFEDGAMKDLGSDFSVNRIGNTGVILGSSPVFSSYSGVFETRAHFYSAGVKHDLNDHVEQNFATDFYPLGPLFLDSCRDINDQGQMICTAQPRWWFFPKTPRAYLLTPGLDTAGPQINNAPGDMYPAATSPQGAVVAYDIGVFDDFDRHPTLTVSPPSGTLFPIGNTTVTCTARDASGNTSVYSFVVHVKGATELLDDLIQLVRSFNLQRGIENSLDAKLQNTQDALTAARSGNLSRACNSMSSFINAALAQSGKALTSDQADQLVAAARQIMAVLGCP
jgi:probable HAF family extracellular repeat protein